MITEKEKIELFMQFLDEIGQFNAFKDFIENKGYTLEELGISD
jgi:hypothetical protein